VEANEVSRQYSIHSIRVSRQYV